MKVQQTQFKLESENSHSDHKINDLMRQIDSLNQQLNDKNTIIEKSEKHNQELEKKCKTITVNFDKSIFYSINFIL